MAALNIGPATVDLSGVRAGDRNAVHVALTANGAPLDLTGVTVTAQARKVENDPAAVDAVIENRVDAAGTFTLRWPGDAIRLLFVAPNVKWSGVWDMQTQTGLEDPVTVVAGKFDAVLDVTRVGLSLMPTSDDVAIHVVDSAIVAVLIGGAWIEVADVVVSFADYTATPGSPVVARGLHLSGRIRSGAHRHDRIVARLAEIQAIRS